MVDASAVDIIDAISTIVNSIAIVVLVLITYYYAKKVSEQTKFMSIDRERSRILDEVKRVLSPYIEQLEKEINHAPYYDLKWFPKISHRTYKGKFTAVGHFYDLEDLNSVGEINEIAFYDVIGKHPEIKPMLEYHDSLVTELENKHQELEDKMFSDNFKNLCMEIFEKFKKENINLINKKYFADPINSFIIPYIMPHIIRNTVSIQSTHIEEELFWNSYREKLIKVRNEEKVEKLIEEFDELIGKFSTHSIVLYLGT